MRGTIAEQLNDKSAEIHRLLKETRVRSKKRRRQAREKLLEKYGIRRRIE